MKQTMITPEFVEFIPDRLQEGVLYISEQYGTVVHKCCCGCGEEVVTPLTPADWQLRREGAAVSLVPSIGNWNFRCKSHYWIRRNRVEWAPSMTKQQIRRVQDRDRQDKEQYIAQVNACKVSGAGGRSAANQAGGKTIGGSALHSLWCWLKVWWNR